MALLRTQSLQELERFLAYEYTDPNNFTSRYPLLDFYSSRDLEKHYWDLAKDLEKYLNNTPIQSGERFAQNLQLKEAVLGYETLRSARNADNSHTTMLFSQLEQFYLLKKIEYLIYDHNNLKSFDSEKRETILSETTRVLALAKPLLEENLALKINHQILTMLSVGIEEEDYQQLLSDLVTHEKFFHIEEMKNFYGCIRAYNIQQINQGNRQYNHHLLALYIYLLGKSYLLDSAGNIIPSTYKNIILLAFREKQFSLAEQIIQNYSHLLDSQHRSYMEGYCTALLKFYQKKYSETRRMLVILQPSDLFIEMDARILMMQCYYEMKELDILEDALNSLRVYISRNKQISAIHKKGRLNFVSCISKIINIGVHQEGALTSLYEQIRATTPLMEKEWLLEKITEHNPVA